MYHNRGKIDSYIFEHAIKPRFWFLGLGIACFSVPTMASASRPQDTKKDGGQEIINNSSNTSLQPRLTGWLAAKITTRSTRLLAITGYLAMLSAQLLEGYWVETIMIRWTAKVMAMWPLDRGIWTDGIYSLSIIAMALMHLSFLGIGAVISICQVGCIAELCCFRFPGRVDEPTQSQEGTRWN